MRAWRTKAPEGAKPEAGGPGLGVHTAISPAIQEKPADRRAVTRRSLGLGLGLVAVMAVLTPYNDYVLRNTPMIGNYFPIGILMIMGALVLLVNPLLQRLARRRLGSGELGFMMALLLVAAAAPSSGLMRYLEPMVLGLEYHVARFPWCQPLVNLLPHWLVPTRESGSAMLANYFLGPDMEAGGKAHVPWLRFLVPALLWGVLISAVYGMAMFLSALFRKQWTVHERLKYPLSTLPLELLDEPEAGQYYNKAWRNPVLWAGAALPAMVYLLSGLHEFMPAVPYVSLTYDFSGAFVEHPWELLPHFIQANRLYLSAVGVCLFVPSEVALSLWLFLVVNGVLKMVLGARGIDTGEMEPVRGIGCYMGYFAGLIWLARGHLRYVARQAWLGRPREAGEFTSYRSMVVGLLRSAGLAWLWMVLAGVGPLAAALVLLGGVVLITVMSRVLAETGLFFLGASWQIPQCMGLLGAGRWISMESFFMSSVVSKVFFGDLRETLMPFATTSLRIGGETPEQEKGRFWKWLFVALALSVVVSGVANHVLSFEHGRDAMGDEHASVTVPVGTMTDSYAFAHGNQRVSAGRAWTQVGFGAAMMGVLIAGRTLIISWPFHPIGLLLMNSWPLQAFWFSIFVGWAIKVVMLRYGGARAFKRARVFFVGLILGEMASAGLWMLVGLLSGGTVTYRLLPG